VIIHLPESFVRYSKASSATVLIPQKFMVNVRVFLHNSRFPSWKNSEVSSVIVLLLRNKSKTLKNSNIGFRRFLRTLPGETNYM